MNRKNIINQATSYTTKLLRNRFGKGPEAVSIYVCEQCIVLHLKNFLSPVEEFLLSQEKEQAFRYTRELIMKSMLPELRQFLTQQLELNVVDLYYDWGMYNASGVIVGLLDNALYSESEDYQGKEQLHKDIIKATTELQKPPTWIDSWWINSKTLFILRKGTTILLEKELISLGYEHMLRMTKGKIEKALLEQETNLEPLFHKKIADLYVDWSFENDHSMIMYTFEE
ncbi:Na-translocating system protein MpsC family protein [Paenibacillus nicotianae]|uniref:Na-translocating system protein MpsC family protein n=1 Tax=Paenibacillus nicotianae TaxID=1526551 RepID=A0ABW4UW81_9BACL